MNPDDARLAALMRAAQEGDSAAYVALLGDVASLLRRVVGARRNYLTEADQEDIVQEILLGVHTARTTFDPARPFLPWLMAIAHNRMADAARRYHRHAAREETLDDADVTFSTEATNAIADGPGDPEALRRAIEDLPHTQRQAITLLKLRDMSLREASDATGLSIGALKVATHRAMAALRRRLTTNSKDDATNG